MKLLPIIAAALLATGCDGLEEERRSAERYCEMRAIYEESDGQHGWPNHDDEKEAMCQKL